MAAGTNPSFDQYPVLGLLINPSPTFVVIVTFVTTVLMAIVVLKLALGLPAAEAVV